MEYVSVINIQVLRTDNGTKLGVLASLFNVRSTKSGPKLQAIPQWRIQRNGMHHCPRSNSAGAAGPPHHGKKGEEIYEYNRKGMNKMIRDRQGLDHGR